MLPVPSVSGAESGANAQWHLLRPGPLTVPAARRGGATVALGEGDDICVSFPSFCLHFTCLYLRDAFVRNVLWCQNIKQVAQKE